MPVTHESSHTEREHDRVGVRAGSGWTYPKWLILSDDTVKLCHPHDHCDQSRYSPSHLVFSTIVCDISPSTLSQLPLTRICQDECEKLDKFKFAFLSFLKLCLICVVVIKLKWRDKSNRSFTSVSLINFFYISTFCMSVLSNFDLLSELVSLDTNVVSILAGHKSHWECLCPLTLTLFHCSCCIMAMTNCFVLTLSLPERVICLLPNGLAVCASSLS